MTLVAKKWVLAGTAIAPFGVSLIPSVYVAMIFFYLLTYPLCLLYGLLWCALFHYVYKQADAQNRRTVRWLALFSVFAFVLPVHIILTLLGVPSLWPHGLAPP